MPIDDAGERDHAPPRSPKNKLLARPFLPDGVFTVNRAEGEPVCLRCGRRLLSLDAAAGRCGATASCARVARRRGGAAVVEHTRLKRLHAALALVNRRRRIEDELLFRVLPDLAPADLDVVATVLDMDRDDLAGWAELDDMRPAVEVLLGRPLRDVA